MNTKVETKTETKLNIGALETQAAEAEAAGFIAAATELRTKALRAKKLAIAYEHYRFVDEGSFQKFNATLKQKTTRPASEVDRQKLIDMQIPHNPARWNGATTLHDELVLVAMEAYKGLPPSDVFEKVKEARGRQCFDRFEVAEIQPVATLVKLPDPIVFGLVDGCTDRFYVCEWGTDVSITDLLKEGQG